jgi:hypothetical protein
MAGSEADFDGCLLWVDQRRTPAHGPSRRQDGQYNDGRLPTLADAKARKWTSAEYEDLNVQAYGDVAIATGGYKGKGTDSGKPFDEHLRWTDTWVKMPDGKWQLVASHYSPIKQKT